MSALVRILEASDVVAVLAREINVRLVEISHSGCLLLCDRRMPEGVAGTLRLSHAGLDYFDDIRVVRCQAPAPGDRWFHIGAEFLWTTHPDVHSLRRLVASLRAPLTAESGHDERRVPAS
jgi:hypothetical protein